jgi:hypothetical protein
MSLDDGTSIILLSADIPENCCAKEDEDDEDGCIVHLKNVSNMKLNRISEKATYGISSHRSDCR